MKSLSDFLADTMHTGLVAGVATTAAVAACGIAEGPGAVAPINAVSHILFGEKATTKDDASAKYTLTGLALNAAAIMSWAAVFEVCCGERAERDPRTALLGGAAVAALAYVTDYHVVPKRLTPGFEERLSNTSLFGVYAVLALALGCAPILRGRNA